MAPASSIDERFTFVPDRFKRDFSKLSESTKSEVLSQHEHSPLQIISVNPTKDYVIAKFEHNSGRWSNEHIGLSTLNGRAIETRVEQEGRFSDRWQVQFTIDKSLTRPTIQKWNQPAPPQESVSSTRLLQKRITSMMLDHVQHLPPEAVLVASAVESDGGGRGRTAIYRRYGFKPDPDSAMGELETEVSIGEFIKRATGRTDATEGGNGKPCGESHIPKSHKCSKSAAPRGGSALRTAAKIALAAGAIAGGAAIAKKAMSMEEWRRHPENPRNTPKLSPEENQRIIDEALAAGQKWDVQERINAHRLADLQAECGGGQGKIQAPAKFDAAIPTPRCQAGAGAFGTYFVHTSEKYGIKLFRNEDEDVDPGWEFDRLGAAHRAGVNVPEPLATNYTKDGTHTLTLRHMKGYREMGDVYSTGGFGLPRIVQLKIARQFRTLHTEGIAHGDIHGGNIMVHPRSKRVALVDFGYSTQIYDGPHRIHNRDGVRNLMGDLERLPEYLGLSSFTRNYRGVLSNIEKQALDYDRSWDKYERAIKRYYDVLEAELLDGERRSRSRFVSGADQPRIPGITRAVLTANANTFQKKVLEQVRREQPTLFAQGAQKLGLKPAQLFRALAPEREARRRKPFGTTLLASS